MTKMRASACHELHVRGQIVDLCVQALNQNPDNLEAWSVVKWALKDLVRLQEQLDGSADELKQTIQEILPILETTRGTS